MVTAIPLERQKAFDKGTEVGFYCAVLPLGLVAGLRIEGGGEFLLDALEVAPELRREDGA